MKKKIKIKMTDLPAELDARNNFVTDALSKYYEVEYSDNPDFLFYAAFGYEYQNYDSNQCVKIFMGGEPLTPNFNDCDYAFGHMPIVFGDRYLQTATLLASPQKKGIPHSIQDRSAVSDDMFERKFCNFVYSQYLPHDGWKIRKDFCEKLMNYKKVDCPGKVLKNMPDGAIAPRWVPKGDGSETVPDDKRWADGKLQFVNGYKFTIAFENAFMDGYTTEKLLDPFLAFSIPIYWGNPNVVKDYNREAFINCNDYDNDFDAVIERIKELDNDKEQYLHMLKQPPMNKAFSFDDIERFERWLQMIVEKGNCPFSKNPAGFVPVSCPKQFEMIFNE